jgi:hypothetical protein
MLHIQRLALDVNVRMTGDADFGVPLHILQNGQLVMALEAVGYRKVMGNRWERRLDESRVASTDLLIAAYTSRPRHTRSVGDVVTTEVPGLAEAFLQPGVDLDAVFRLSTGEQLTASITLPDAMSMVLLKLGARRVRSEDRDATDLLRCLEIAYADGVRAEAFQSMPDSDALRAQLVSDLTGTGSALAAINRDGSTAAARQTEIRIQALLATVAGA